MPEQLEQGALVQARVPCPRGKTKKRPVIILTRTQEIVFDEPLVAVAVTTTFPDPAPDTHVELPWHPQRHPATQLCRRSAAVCNWLVPLRPSEIIEVRGYVPSKWLLTIIERVRTMNQ